MTNEFAPLRTGLGRLTPRMAWLWCKSLTWWVHTAYMHLLNKTHLHTQNNGLGKCVCTRTCINILQVCCLIPQAEVCDVHGYVMIMLT